MAKDHLNRERSEGSTPAENGGRPEEESLPGRPPAVSARLTGLLVVIGLVALLHTFVVARVYLLPAPVNLLGR